MGIQLLCSKCGSKIVSPERLAGKKVKCPKCGTLLLVPDASPPPPSESVVAEPPPIEQRIDPLDIGTFAPQNPPAEADPPPPLAPVVKHKASATEVPDYDGVKAVAVVFKFLGGLCFMGGIIGFAMVMGFASSFGGRDNALATGIMAFGVTCLGLLIGIMYWGFGEAFNCLRDIARNSFRQT